ncbi:MAG: zinc metallopeptidase [Acidobacteria bacterium]|jgi:Zn-dependent membrane protease YugP|nr:zinc metallopeptidase [Acidobacteriota bacterium]
MYFDPMYFLFILPAFVFSLWASWRTKANFKTYSKVPVSSGMSGAEAAERVLQSSGITDVAISRSRGLLSDHYNPASKTLALSDGVFDSRSLAAVGIAAHEAGHAIQHSKGYGPLKLRSMLVPTASIGSNLGYIVMLLGLFLASQNMVMVGAVLFSAVLVFQIVTLPVEFDASNRAKALVVENGIVAAAERRGMDKVLNAAAMTYVAAVASSLTTLLYFLVRSGLLGGSRD